MQDAVIGHTGFVGQTLLSQNAAFAGFNSATIHQAAGQEFGTLICAAAPGSMFEANRFPDRDGAAIDSLIDSLSRLRAQRFVLISTIAVLDRFDSGATESSASFREDLAYGRNRRRLEEFCATQFDQCLILRLPALFGAGLRKNFIFDLLNPVPSMLPDARLDALLGLLPDDLAALARGLYRQDPRIAMQVLDREALDRLPQRPRLERGVTEAGFSAIGFTSPDSRFQFYDMSRLWADIRVAMQAGLSVLHMAPAPLSAAEVHAFLTGGPMPASGARPHHEDMRTEHAHLWGHTGPYLMAAEESLSRLKAFFDGGKA